MSEPKLTYAPLPSLGRRKLPDGVEYKYAKYIPLVEQFAESGEPAARVESDEKGLIGHVHNAIFHSSANGRFPLPGAGTNVFDVGTVPMSP